MKIINRISLLLLLLGVVPTFAQEKEHVYAPSFRYAPDRDFDLAWENDLVAFRVYGLQPTPDAGLSGVDCWHKKVAYPIADKWYKGNLAKSGYYHKEHGEGCDRYHVGKTRGCGGVGIWKNNEILRSGLYESWEVISQTQTSLSFKLVYSWNIDGERIVENRIITLENGSQLYEAISYFTKNSIPIKDMEIAIGLSTQNGIAKVSFNEEEGWFSAWHTLGEGYGMIGTGAIVSTAYLVKMFEQKSENKDESHALAIVKTDANGVIKYKSGFAWEMADKITTQQAWNAYLSNAVQ
jgi:hypothetical protein